MGQKVDISFLKKDVGTEFMINYDDGRWVWLNNCFKECIYTFDNDFIHKHLITWVETTHWNKETFTNFILWAEAVEAINKIEAQKVAFNTSKNELKLLKPPYLKSESREEKIDAFIDLKVDTPLDQLREEMVRNVTQLKNLQSSTTIVNWPIVPDMPDSLIKNVQYILARINEICEKDFKDVTDATLTTIKNHISWHTNSWETVDEWIKSWFLEHKKDNECPFCGQDTHNIELLREFGNLFNELYSIFESSINKELQSCVNDLQAAAKSDLYGYFNSAIFTIRKYSQYEAKLVISDDMGKKLEQLKILEVSFSTKLDTEKERIKLICGSKKRAPHKKIEGTTLSLELQTEYVQLITFAKTIYDELVPLIGVILELKKYHQWLIAKGTVAEKARLEWVGNILALKITRKEQSVQCDAYAKRRWELQKSGKEISDAELALEIKQTVYLDKYFTTINQIYRDFWNRNFELIKKEWPKRGNRKTYFLSVKYKGQEVSETDFPKIMSESEKRSLAFAVFLARIDHLEPSLKASAVIVLDDPVVSFDQTRIDATVRYIRNHLTWVFCQVIILTHYESFIKTIQEQYKNLPWCFFYQLVNWWKYESRDKKYFLQSIESVHFSSLSKFINRETDIIEKGLPRVFMEKYVDARFRKQLHEWGLSYNDDLKDKIAILTIDETKKNDLQSLRIEFNDPHHDFTNPLELENFRTSTANLIDLLYKL